MATIEDLRDLGYDVGQSFPGEDFTVYRVEGFGVSRQVRDDDEDGLASLADSHEERVAQEGESTDETLLRWHDDKDNPFELPKGQVGETRKRVKEAAS